MATTPSAVGAGLLARFFDKVSTHKLALVVGFLFALDFVTPDPLPFIDEIVLLTLTILLARWQNRGATPVEVTTPPTAKPPVKNVTPTPR